MNVSSRPQRSGGACPRAKPNGICCLYRLARCCASRRCRDFRLRILDGRARCSSSCIKLDWSQRGEGGGWVGEGRWRCGQNAGVPRLAPLARKDTSCRGYDLFRQSSHEDCAREKHGHDALPNSNLLSFSEVFGAAQRSRGIRLQYLPETKEVIFLQEVHSQSDASRIATIYTCNDLVHDWPDAMSVGISVLSWSSRCGSATRNRSQ